LAWFGLAWLRLAWRGGGHTPHINKYRSEVQYWGGGGALIAAWEYRSWIHSQFSFPCHDDYDDDDDDADDDADEYDDNGNGECDSDDDDKR
jgi:hypothetical protein